MFQHSHHDSTEARLPFSFLGT